MREILLKIEKKEGEFFCKWLYQRLIVKNKNVLGANLGPTGSGKSYRDLRMAELWYKYYFKEEFPVEHICFGVTQVMELISSGKLRKGDIIIFEESGVNLGNLDFQNKVSKMFTYVLQSFRSMNIAIFFNLPYFSMLNKSARMLLHYTFESMEIDHARELNICKPKFLQVNQVTGKIYPKYQKRTIPKVGNIKVKRLGFSLPSDYIIEAYEKKKLQFLAEITSEYTEHLRELEREKNQKLERPELTDVELEVYNLACKGLMGKEIAQLLGKVPSTISETLTRVKRKGYLVKIEPNPLENPVHSTE